MEWRDWELFCEVVQHGGFSAAARVLGHPKSSLSAAVQRLEGNLGIRLIERTTRHLRLTDAGETIFRRVQPLFAALHDTRSEALAMSSSVAGVLRIKAPYEFGAHHAGPVACELMSRYPELTIRIDVEHDIVSPVAENYDIVFAMLEAPLPSNNIIIRRMFSLERGLFAAPSLLERLGEPTSWADLTKFPLLTGPSDAPWAITTPEGTVEHLDVQKARLVSSNAHVYEAMFGPRLSVPIGRLRPFAEFEVGVAHATTGNAGLGTDTSFATALGGGVDFRLFRPVAWRVEGDYVRTDLFHTTQGNFRFSTGIVLRF